MKKIKLLLFVAGITTGLLASGQVPQMIDYQGMARDGSGKPLDNFTIGVRMSVLTGPLPGTLIYSERHTPSTNSYGLFHLMIGDGIALTGTFSCIIWTGGDYYIQTEIDPSGGTTYIDMGKSKLATVPFAFYAANAGNESPWQQSGSDIYYVGGNVAIAHYNPLVKLMVKEESSAGVLGSDLGSLYSQTQTLSPAIYGFAKNNTSDISSGIMGQSSSTGSNFNEGVFGLGSGGSVSNFGVYGVGMGGAGSFYSFGIYGDDEGSASSNYAGYFYGNVKVVGTLSKSGGSFKIDHPQDPTNRYLAHSFVESPDMMNVYNGNVRTDGSGFAVVELPSYFEVLNIDFRYQLTVIGEFAQAIIKEEISGNQFTIQTDKPNVKVSWQVTGIRNDVWAQENRIQVEVIKESHEKGRYMHPELYGKSKDMGLKTGVPH